MRVTDAGDSHSLYTYIANMAQKLYFKVLTPLSRFSFAYQTVMTRDHTMVKTGWLGDQKPLETTFKLFLGLSLSSIFMLISPFSQ